MRIIVAFAIIAASLVLDGCSREQAAYTSSPRPHPPKALKTTSARTSKPLHGEKSNDGGTYSHESRHRLPPSESPSVSADSLATARYYVVLDPVDNCAVLDTKPSAVAGTKTFGDKGGYASLEAANKALNDAKAKCKRVVE
jgi:hypothetical protein